MSLVEVIEEAEVAADGSSVVFDGRASGGCRLEIHPGPLDGYRAILQDDAGICWRVWKPGWSRVDAGIAALTAYLEGV